MIVRLMVEDTTTVVEDTITVVDVEDTTTVVDVEGTTTEVDVEDITMVVDVEGTTTVVDVEGTTVAVAEAVEEAAGMVAVVDVTTTEGASVAAHLQKQLHTNKLKTESRSNHM